MPKQLLYTTNGQMPKPLIVPRDGKAFYHADSLFNFTLIGCKQLGMDLIIDNKLDYSSDTFKRVWNGFYEPAVKGHLPSMTVMPRI
ncbi:MAG: hypothetical protein ACOX47_08905 [Bacillota bacterium]